MKIDLNCDLGESFGAYKLGQDKQILELISSVNIACGYHAGDHNVMAETVSWAVEKQVAIGAHPGLPDLMGFGRREMAISSSDIYHLMIYQMGALEGFLKLHDTKLRHVKAHGALYNMAAKDAQVADAVAQAVYDFDATLILYGLAESELISAGQRRGLKVAAEAFADRSYLPNGHLTPRHRADALIDDPQQAAKRVLQMIGDGSIEAVDGSLITMKPDTICIHGDSLQAISFAQALCTALQEAQVAVTSL